MLNPSLALAIASHSIASLAAFQADSINSGNSKLLMFFVGLAAFALFAQALVMVVIGVGAAKAQKAIMEHVLEIKAKALPLIDKSHTLVNDLTPQIHEITAKINVITAHVEHLAALVHEKADEFSPTVSAANQTFAAANETVKDANLKTRVQVKRVDGMVTTALNATARLGAAIEQGISKPSREVAGIVAGLKAGLETLVNGARVFGSGAPLGRQTPPRPVSPYRDTYSKRDL